jgi:crossover junction endodeoxyribonuclease RuvC
MIMGLDLSMTGTGLVVMDGNTIIHQKLIETSPKMGDDITRIGFILRNILGSMVQVGFPTHHYTERPTVAMEGPSYGVAGATRSLHTLGKMMGIIEYYLKIEKQLKIEIIPPTSLKKIITGKGSGKKEMMLKEVYKRYGIDFNDNNLCDAFCLCVAISPVDLQKSGVKLATISRRKKL